MYQRSSNEIHTFLLNQDKGSQRPQEYTLNLLKGNYHQSGILYAAKIAFKHKDKNIFGQTKTEISWSLAFLKAIIKGILQAEGNALGWKLKVTERNEK